MLFNTTSIRSNNPKRLQFHQQKPETPDLVSELIAGLKHKPATIPPKFFYNSKGAALFDQITELAEYYPTRTEHEIFKQYCTEIVTATGTNRVLIEPGSGSSEKVQLLLAALRPSAYVPIEITESHLKNATRKLAQKYDWLTIHAICADYSEDITLPDNLPTEPRLVFFPGSTIGNFEPDAAKKFMQNLHKLCGKNGALLIGVDLIKDKTILEAAYNDKNNITAAFNLNILEHVNQLAAANFRQENFQHIAFYNTAKNRIEMHLESQCDQIVSVAKQTIRFRKGERIHTENSYKYSIASFQQLANSAGFKAIKTWCDTAELFSVQLFNTSVVG